MQVFFMQHINIANNEKLLRYFFILNWLWTYFKNNFIDKTLLLFGFGSLQKKIIRGECTFHVFRVQAIKVVSTKRNRMDVASAISILREGIQNSDLFSTTHKDQPDFSFGFRVNPAWLDYDSLKVSHLAGYSEINPDY